MPKPIPPPSLHKLVFDASQHPGIMQPDGNFWLFAYGSLMWNPDFEFLRCETARLYGYQRRLCLWSVEYRGTLQNPGLVMGLDSGGSCLGRVFLISQDKADETIEKLNQREMITGAYTSLLKTLHLQTGERIKAVCLMAKQDHPQYVPALGLEATAEIVNQARGKYGHNTDYVLNTVQHMQDMGINPGSLKAVAKLLNQ